MSIERGIFRMPDGAGGQTGAGWGGGAAPGVRPLNGGGARPAGLSSPPRPLPGVADAAEGDPQRSQIKHVSQNLAGGAKHLENWKRQPNKTGAGATHVRSFHCKLTGETLENLDRQINEWLDTHPEYEVKFVTSSVGDWTGKIREPNLIVQVWV